MTNDIIYKIKECISGMDKRHVFFFNDICGYLFLKLKEFNLFCGHIRPVAQMVEHLTLNQGVEGSIPSGPTKIWITDLSTLVISRV